MTGQNLSRLATRFRQNLGLFVAMAAIGLTNTSVLAQSYSYAPPQVYGSGPSGSVSGNVVNYDGRGMGVMLRGGHAAGNAIGREESISYISGMPYATFGETMLFGDARLARANRGGLAWSFGAGFRHYFSDVDAVFGLNGYLDNDQLVDDFQSWGVGAELLADQWEWRGNMYKPFGDSRFQTSVEAADGSVQFSGNQILFDRVRNFATALEGYDTEIGFLLPGRIAQERQIRAFGGGYVYETDARDAVGWKARLQAQPMEFLELGLQVSNDRLFDTSLVFNVAVQLGGFRENRPSRSARYRMAEPVRRNISIATGDVAVTEEDVPVLGADGAPVTVAHVSSLVGRAVGVGSVDDPFQTIQQGQFAGSDIVFVHAGSRFDVPGENSVLMTPGQRILGEGLLRGRPVAATHLVDIPEIGLTALPSAPSFFADSTLSQPIISGANPIGVTLANDVEFSGFIVENVTQDAVFGDGVENVVLNQNSFVNAGRDGVRLINPTGSFELSDTVIEDTDGIAFHVQGGDADIVFTQTNAEADPGFGRIENTSGNIIRVADTTGGNISFSLATLDDAGGEGVLIERAAGDVTIDNLSVVGSTSNGISITDSSGQFVFRSSIRGQTLLENTTLAALNIERLAEEGRVRFVDDLLINDRQAGGINIQQSAGAVNFADAIAVNAAAGGGPDPGINIQDNLSTSSVNFVSSTSVTNGAGVGINISGGQVDAGSGARAQVRFNGPTLLQNQAGDSLLITNDSSDISFADLTSSLRGGRGIALVNAHGFVDFNGPTTVLNENGDTDSGVEILGSQGVIRFLGQTFVTDGQGLFAVVNNPTVNIVGNQPDTLGPATILFEDLNITSDQSDSLSVRDSNSVIVRTGTILTGTAASVDIENSGIQMEFVSINNDLGGLAPNAIRIVDTFAPGNTDGLSLFEVVGDEDDLGAGQGGIIENSAGAAVLLTNAGTVRLEEMFFDTNEIAFDVSYTGLSDPPAGSFSLTQSDVQDSAFLGLRGLNIPSLVLDNVLFDNNGTRLPNSAGPDGAETILLTYDETPNDPDTTDPEDYDTPYNVFMRNVSVIDNSDDAVVIQALATAEDAHLNLDVEDSIFTATDIDLDVDGGGVLREGSPFDQFNDSAFIVRWNGPMEVSVINNEFNILSGNDDPQVGFDLQNDQSSDFSEIIFRENVIVSASDFLLTTADRHTGLRIDLEGESDVAIEQNAITATGTDFTGMELEFDSRSNLVINDNAIQAVSVAGAEGIVIDRLTEPTNLTFEGNTVAVGAGFVGEVGVSIRAVGVIDLFSTVNNDVFSFGGNDFRYAGPTPRGAILINNQPLP